MPGSAWAISMHGAEVEAGVEKGVGQPAGEVDVEEGQEKGRLGQHSPTAGALRNTVITISPARMPSPTEDAFHALLENGKGILGHDHVRRPHGQVAVRQVPYLDDHQAQGRSQGDA